MATNSRITQVKAALRNHVLHHHLETGDRLPSEGEMAKMLGVSRNTLREAYVALENEGFIIRRHGIGTFVARPPRIKDSLNAFASFAEIIRTAGYTPHFETLLIKTMLAPQEICDQMQVQLTDTLVFIKRLVFADEHPAIYINDYFSPEVQAYHPDWDAFDGNVVQFLSNTLETPLYQLHSRIRAVSLSGEATAMLRQPPGTAAISVQSTIYTIKHSPVTYSKLWFNSNIIELETVRVLHNAQ